MHLPQIGVPLPVGGARAPRETPPRHMKDGWMDGRIDRQIEDLNLRNTQKPPLHVGEGDFFKCKIMNAL